MQRLKDIRRLVARVRRRVRLQLAARRFLLLGGVGLFAFGVVVLLVKTRAVPTAWTAYGAVLAATLAAGGLVSGLLRRLDDVRLAAALDEAGALHSRLGSALAFARRAATPGPDPSPVRAAFEQAAIEDALAVLDRASPKAAAPWPWASFAGGALIAAVALAITVPTVFALDFPVGRTGAHAVGAVGPAPAPFARPKAELDATEIARLEELEAEMAAAARVSADDEIKGLLEDLEALARAIAAGTITPEEAFARLAALEQAREAWNEAHAEELEAVEQALREAAAKRKGGQEDFEALLAALREQALAEAAKALESAADKLQRGAMDQRQQDRLQRDMAALASALESARQASEREAKRERDRLKEKEQRAPEKLGARDRDRLKEKERQLEQLQREEEGLGEARRQLERLQRELGQAAQDMLRRSKEQADQGMTAEQMRQAAEMLRRISEQAQGRQQLRSAAGRMGDLRELLKRAGQRQASKSGGSGAQGREGRAMERFSAKARGDQAGRGEEAGQGGQEGPPGQGKDGQGAMELSQGGQDGQGGLVLLGPPQGAGGQRPGVGQGQEGGEAQAGDGIGQGHDSRLLGEKTALDTKTQDDFVAGAEGAGEQASRVLSAAAERGFATRAYRDVHQDYSAVVEDDLDRQLIPAGQRAYVRRYFDLIRPR